MSTDTVTIACKLPNGLRLDVTGKDGVRQSVTIRGNRLATNPDGLPIQSHEIAGNPLSSMLADSYGLTPNVPADFWAQWAKENANYTPYKLGMVFAQGEHASAAAQAREVYADVKTGLEPMDRDKPAPGIVPVKPDA